MNFERQRVLKITANQGSVCMFLPLNSTINSSIQWFLPITLYIKLKNDSNQQLLSQKLEIWFLVGVFMHANYFSGIIIFLNLTVYELLALPHPLLPTLRHETVVSIIQLQIWNQHHLLPYPTSILLRNYQEYSLRSFAVLLITNRPKYIAAVGI